MGGTLLTRDNTLARAEIHLAEEVSAHPYALIFITVSGAHLYGFPSADSDFDLRGAHVVPARQVLGLRPIRETIESDTDAAGLEIETVTHDIRKYVRLLLNRNGYVLEQLYSPLVIHTTPEHEEMKRLGRGCITPKHALHYLGFAHNEWKLLEQKPSLKRLLYVYRVLLTGIHLMRTGDVEANLVRLNDEYKLPQLPGLITQKVNGSEWAEISGDLAFHQSEYERLCSELEAAAAASALPKTVSSEDDLDDFVVRTRLSMTRSM